jgi:hypothetical protein
MFWTCSRYQVHETAFVLCFHDSKTFDLVGRARICNSVKGEELDGARSVLATMFNKMLHFVCKTLIWWFNGCE